MPYKHGVTGSIPVAPTMLALAVFSFRFRRWPMAFGRKLHSITASRAFDSGKAPESAKVKSTICGPVVQLVRTPACHAGGRRFEPVLGRHRRGILLPQYAYAV